MMITSETHPNLYGVLLDILHDCGANGRDRDNAAINFGQGNGTCVEFEMALSALSPDDRTTLAIGEFSESLDLRWSTPMLTKLGEALDDWFNEGD